MDDLDDATPAVERLMAGISLLVAQSAILNNPFYTETEARKFLAIRRAFHAEFVLAAEQFADECEAGLYGSAAKALTLPLRGISRLQPNQTQQALVLVARTLRGMKTANLYGEDVSPLVRRLIQQAARIREDNEEEDRYVDFIDFFKTVIRFNAVPLAVKTLLRKVIQLGGGTSSRNTGLGLKPHFDANPGAWFDMSPQERASIRDAVNESDRIWKEATDERRSNDEVRDAWLRSQEILQKAIRLAGVHPNIIKGDANLEPLEDALKREQKMEVDGPTSFALDQLRKEYARMVKKEGSLPREQRKLMTVLSKVKTLDTFERVLREAQERKIIPNYMSESVQSWLGNLNKNKAIKEGIPLAPLTWKPMSVTEFQAAHDTGTVTFTEDLTEEQQQEILGRVSRAISDLETVFGKGFCGKHEKKLAFRFGSGGGSFMAKASYFAWDNPNVWQPQVRFGADYEGVLAHELSHYLDDLLDYKLESVSNPDKKPEYHSNIFGRTGVSLDYFASMLDGPGSKQTESMNQHLPELRELVKAIVGLPDYARWKDLLSSPHEMTMFDAVKSLTGIEQYNLPPDHPYHSTKTDAAKYRSDLPPELLAETERLYKNLMRGDNRKLTYYHSSVEVWARVCEQYVYNKLARKGVANPWLNWMTYEDDRYVENETFETVLEPILDRLFARLKDRQMLASIVRRFLSASHRNR